MNKALTENWNSVVSPEDTIYHMGDFAFGGIKKYLPYLNGKIILIRGNHDRGSDLKGCGLLVLPYLDIEYGGYHFKLNHRPQFKATTPDPFNDGEKRHPFDINSYDWMLAGHVHEHWVLKEKNINVGVDVWDFKPVTLDHIIETVIKPLTHVK